MCKSCRSYDCILIDNGLVCNECNRWFKNKNCYDQHKESVDGARSVCQTIKKCEKCGKSVDVRHLNPKGQYLWKEMLDVRG